MRSFYNLDACESTTDHCTSSQETVSATSPSPKVAPSDAMLTRQLLSEASAGSCHNLDAFESTAFADNCISPRETVSAASPSPKGAPSDAPLGRQLQLQVSAEAPAQLEECLEPLAAVGRLSRRVSASASALEGQCAPAASIYTCDGQMPEVQDCSSALEGRRESLAAARRSSQDRVSRASSRRSSIRRSERGPPPETNQFI